MKFKEFINRSVPIVVEMDGNTAEGVVSILNWLYSIKKPTNILNRIPVALPIAILKNMFVEEEQRGKGIGNYLLNEFISKATSLNAKCILLESDTGEEQEKGFDLTKWYENKGFTKITNGNYPLMYKYIKGD
jgi:GNAT superfamily N-acetyltransferase